MQAGNAAVEESYSKGILGFKEGIIRFFDPTPESRDPQEVADAILNLVELPQGQRPLFTIVGGGPQTANFEKVNSLLQEIVETTMGLR